MQTSYEDHLRERLSGLAENERGRGLLQLSLRGIQQDERELTAGCWTRTGIAGCLFQHAYWQGVREGVFTEDGSARDWVSSYAGHAEYWNVINTIAAFDDLARHEYLDGPARRLPFGRGALRSDAWRTRVESMLLDALAPEKPAQLPECTVGD
ncbi:MAG: hypothetical protein QOJ13_2186 [Gaiellales bacterium]|nr:hypothetical protein [Gaiellales bacterium]